MERSFSSPAARGQTRYEHGSPRGVRLLTHAKRPMCPSTLLLVSRSPTEMSAPVASARAASVRTGMRCVTGTGRGGEGARRLSILIEEGLVKREARLLSVRGGGEGGGECA